MLPTLDQLAKGEVGNVKKVLNTICNDRYKSFLDTQLNEYDRPVRVMDFDHTPTMNEMCIKYGKSFIDVLKHNRDMKLVHNLYKKGFWLGKNQFKHRYTAEVPVQIHGNPRNPLYWQYFNPECTDPQERRKNLYAFLRKYDMAFSPIEKL